MRKPIIVDVNILFDCFDIRRDLPDPNEYHGSCLIVTKALPQKAISFIDEDFKPTDFDDIREEYMKRKIILFGKEVLCWERVR